MIPESRPIQVGFLVLAVLLTPTLRSPLAAQASSRFRIVVPDLRPEQGADRGFGEDVAKELRDLLDDLATHRAVDDDDIEDAAGRYGIGMRDLDCISTRQLVSQTELGEVIFCGSYAPRGGQYVIDASIIEVTSGETVDVEPIEVAEGDDGAAARLLFESFDRFNRLTRAARFCSDYYQSQQFENALRNCDEAVELNPEGTRSLYIRGLVYKDMDDQQRALEDMRAVLEVDPVHEDALQWAGWLATTLGMAEAGREYYNQYLELNPANAGVRMRIAYDMAQAGDPEGAMLFIQEGIDLDDVNLDLWQQLGNFAISAAANEMREAGQMTAQAAEYYRTGIDAYQRVLAAQDTAVTLSASQLRAMISGYIQLEQLEDARTTAEEVLEQYPDEPRLWAIYGEALRRMDDIPAAIQALDRVRDLDPDYPDLAIRHGNLLLDLGRVEAALTHFRQAAEQGEDGDRVVQGLLAYGYGQGVERNRYALAVDVFAAAGRFDVSAAKAAEISFWHGFSLYRMAEAAQEPQTLETARRTLPWFQQARRLLEAGRAYAASRDGIPFGQILSAVDRYIQIQEAIIRRGR